VRRSWLLLLALCAGALTLADAYLTGRGTNLFTGGFNVVEPLRSPPRFALYLAASLVFDAACVLAAWSVALPLLRRTRLAPRQILAAAALVALAPPLVFLYVRHSLSRFMGDLLDWRLLLALAGGSPLEWLAQGSAHLVPVVAAVSGALAVAFLLVRALRGGAARGDTLEPPSARVTLLAFAFALALSAAILPGACLRGGAACEALSRKAAGAGIVTVSQRVTDFDLDGYGLVPRPADAAPFDPSRHPFALDVPGNGVDENGLAGDHPADYRAPDASFGETPRFAHTPDFLFVFLEGMRADMIGARLGEREITPFLNRVATEGASSAHAYANSPYTSRSRGQLLGGRLAPFPGQSTLLDDFRANGYEVAWFSGQDESFGERESAMLGRERTDVHRDARDDADRSVSAYRTSGSLAISWKLVNERIAEYLARRDPARPLLLYVNYSDTHFPYDHVELDDLLGAPRLARRAIQPENAAEVYATYANAAANVDRAIGSLVERLRARPGARELALLVTSDHGEALFEDGVLGHGLALDAAQTRVPLVVSGVGGEWPEPIGLSDVRGALQRALAEPAGPAPRPRFVPRRERRVLQYMAVPETPRLLALRGLDTELRYDTRDTRPPDSPEFAELVRWWEALQLAEARRGADR
jgi:hypothetical protein